ncbi:MAG: hypothetical protein QG673_473 [Pseudomonadota bacterium]|nr:hypothetical protein [Pseudomonadota bacterium]
MTTNISRSCGFFNHTKTTNTKTLPVDTQLLDKMSCFVEQLNKIPTTANSSSGSTNTVSINTILNNLKNIGNATGLTLTQNASQNAIESITIISANQKKIDCFSVIVDALKVMPGFDLSYGEPRLKESLSSAFSAKLSNNPKYFADLERTCQYLLRDRAKSQGGEEFHDFIKLASCTFKAINAEINLNSKDPSYAQMKIFSEFKKGIEESTSPSKYGFGVTLGGFVAGCSGGVGASSSGISFMSAVFAGLKSIAVAIGALMGGGAVTVALTAGLPAVAGGVTLAFLAYLGFKVHQRVRDDQSIERLLPAHQNSDPARVTIAASKEHHCLDDSQLMDTDNSAVTDLLRAYINNKVKDRSLTLDENFLSGIKKGNSNLEKIKTCLTHLFINNSNSGIKGVDLSPIELTDVEEKDLLAHLLNCISDPRNTELSITEVILKNNPSDKLSKANPPHPMTIHYGSSGDCLHLNQKVQPKSVK